MSLKTLHSTKDFFRVWFTWKKHALLAFCFIVGAIMLFSYVYTPTYRSTAKILLLPKTSEGSVLSTGGREDARPVSQSSVSIEDINSEIELLTSDEVFRNTVASFVKKEPGIAVSGDMGLKSKRTSWSDKMMDYIKYALNETLIFLKLKTRMTLFDSYVALLGDSLEIEPVAASNIILVNLEAEVPKATQVVLDKLLDVYIAHHNEAYTKTEGVQFFEDQSATYRERLAVAETDLKKLQKRWDIIDLARQKDTNITLLSELSHKLIDVKTSYDVLKNRIEELREFVKQNAKDVVITSDMRNIPAIVELEKSIVPLLVKRAEIMNNFMPSSKEYSNIESQISILRDEVKKEIDNAMKAEELEFKILHVKMGSLQNKIRQLQEETNTLNQVEKQHHDMDREIELLNKNYKLYAAKTEDARIHRQSLKLDLANVSIANKATLPLKPFFPNRVLMLILSVFVGIFAALGTPFILEFLDHAIKIPDDVVEFLSLSVVCNLPEVKDK
ncbi:MAG: hypothetical protein A2W05_06445 [Candidatus Schekmanbacteria bacterium RBG_16_38_10]|uniref:Polysaccharide chain length determinant N-terminal domain-containing protein n=1 Tax=Candidatus Schekmanbacteria bacterium RBG_16_38_10 TaxID=1817879 RepID=A0A1F7RU34_9BACT|nr:MAG: hypothetical protein A2W05_06445 [Candidatus Schekmanbacteria bacterium RBG_16_38_10]